MATCWCWLGEHEAQSIRLSIFAIRFFRVGVDEVGVTGLDLLYQAI